MLQLLPNLQGRTGARVKELQKKLAEREDRSHSMVGKQDFSAGSSKMSAKVIFT